MKREVAIFIETALAQTELNYSRLELFNDEKISVSSTIQNISDISKIYTDFSQGFTIPCSPINNAIFQHFYQNDVDATILYQNRYNAYIEIDTTFFRRGKIQLEKTNLKNGKPDSYSVTFYGAGVSLKDYFNEDKLNQLDYTTLNHYFTNTEVYNRVTIDSSVNDYNVRYPLITSKKVWQFGASVPMPTANLPSWYTYPNDNSNNLGHFNGRIFLTDLFPAVRVASIFDLIQTKYGITFNGIFLTSDMFRKAFLWYKNKSQIFEVNSPTNVTWASTSVDPADQVIFNTTNNTFQNGIFQSSANGGVFHDLAISVTSTTPIGAVGYLDLYVNGVFAVAYSIYDGLVTFPIPINGIGNGIISFIIRTTSPIVFNITFDYIAYSLPNYIPLCIAQATSVTNCAGRTDLAGLAPDMKIADFVSGICKEFNMTAYSTEKNVFTFDPIPYWYGRGVIKDITTYVDVKSIEIERMKLYKSIEFKYQDSECFMNKAFLESPFNADAHGYGNLKKGWNYDGGEYKIESPFENLLHNNFQNNLQVGYALNKEFTSYIPKPCLLYMNQKTNLTSGQIFWNGQANITGYVPFGQDSNILTTQGLIPLTLNFGAEISTFYNVVNTNTLYELYYGSYLNNLYNKKNRLVKVKAILPISLLTTLKLNDRLVIRDKRYMINEMQSDLTMGDVNFSLISDFAEVKPFVNTFTPVSTGGNQMMPIIFGNGVTEVSVLKSANASNVTLSNVKFTTEEFLIIGVPPNVARIIEISLISTYQDGSTDTSYIIINQQ